MSIKELFELALLENEVAIYYANYSGVVVRTPSEVLIFDPADQLSKADIEGLKRVDLVLYTHGHYDHYNLSTLSEIFRKTNAYVVVEPSLYRSASSVIPKDRLFSADKQLNIGHFVVTPIEGKHVGPITLYLVKLSKFTLFHGGDSAYVPLKGYKADLALVPTGDPSPTASPKDAFSMVKDLNPKAVAVFHGSKKQHEEFSKLLKKEMPQVSLTTLEKGKLFKISL